MWLMQRFRSKDVDKPLKPKDSKVHAKHIISLLWRKRHGGASAHHQKMGERAGSYLTSQTSEVSNQERQLSLDLSTIGVTTRSTSDNLHAKSTPEAFQQLRVKVRDSHGGQLKGFRCDHVWLEQQAEYMFVEAEEAMNAGDGAVFDAKFDAAQRLLVMAEARKTEERKTDARRRARARQAALDALHLDEW